MAPVVVFVPIDAASRSVGADEVATAIVREAGVRQHDVRVVRNGSRGMFWLEPLVEVTTPAGRVAYGPVQAGSVAELLDAGMLDGAPHRLCLGLTEEISYLKRQTRFTFARVGINDPLSVADYEASGGLAGLHRGARHDASGDRDRSDRLRPAGPGRGGFPTGIKWQTVLNTASELKFIACNADEGDSGTFADRMLMEGDPFLVVEGMVIAGLAVGAREGYIYIRSEYPDAVATMSAAIDIAYLNGWVGPSVLGTDRTFDLHLRVGAGSYICGEETAMLESLEGRRGVIRAKPPLPAIAGLFGKPTVVNNVLSLATVPPIIAQGAEAFRELGVGRSRGTQVFQLAGNIKHGGIVETAFGITLGELVEEFGGGTASGRQVRSVQVGGPLGAYLPTSRFDLPMDYEAFAAAGAMVGHGGIVVFDETVDMSRQARFAMEFCAEESCGKCTPCRVGAVRGVEVIDRIIAGDNPEANLELLEDLCETMVDGSLCAMGGLTPLPVRSALEHFPEDFEHVIAAPR